MTYSCMSHTVTNDVTHMSHTVTNGRITQRPIMPHTVTDMSHTVTDDVAHIGQW